MRELDAPPIVTYDSANPATLSQGGTKSWRIRD